MDERTADDVTVMSGVTEDIFSLIKDFAERKSWLYNAFKETWHALGFDYIFSGRHHLFELQCFTKELFIRFLYFTQPGHTMYERLGALYALYTLFLVQPLLKPIKIRMTVDDFNTIRTLVDSLKGETPQPAYCFYALLKKNAFDFVFCSHTCEKGSGCKLDKESRLMESLKLQTTSRKNIGEKLDEIGFDQIGWMKIQKSYNERKLKINALLGNQNEEFELRDFMDSLKDFGVPKFDFKKESMPIERRKKSTARKRRRVSAALKVREDQMDGSSEDHGDCSDDDDIDESESLPELHQ